MKLEHIVAVAVRLFSIALIIYSLQYGVTLVGYSQAGNWELATYFYLGIIVAPIILAIFLWFFPLTVSRKLVDFRESGESDASSATAYDIQVIGFTMLGAYFLFRALSDIIYWASFTILTGRDKHLEVFPWSAEQLSSMVLTGIELVFAVGLLLGAAGLTKLIRKVRYS